ncbi:hypothetical protein CYMTET_48226 [Cymbomonas tetramitiformis]|uniref:Uncharacterized protein n=1 Tax=Cymbomonas tetramitiformis TaxID=36881 RepID=A0AAE0BSP3_9CHLO|nr:hypothetical protein CYMTET_48226 [Cymbomonas tetramitiformis]
MTSRHSRGGRQQEHRRIVAEYFHVAEAELRQWHLDKAGKLEVRRPKEGFVSHAELVVAAVKGSQTEDEPLECFVRGWREHFVKEMRPGFLPKFWDVSNRVTNSSAGELDT